MGLREPTTTQPPEASGGWTFDEEESWGTARLNPAAPDPAAPDPSRLETAVPHPTGPDPAILDPAAADPATEPSWGELSAGGHGPQVAAPLVDPATATDATSGRTTVSHPARMMLGLASLAARRVRGGVPAGEALTTGVGLVQETAAGLRDLGRRVLEPASKFAADTVDRAALLPGASIPVRSLSRSRAELAKVMAKARARGEQTVAAGRADAEAFVRSSVAETLNWAQAQAVPQIVDGLVPHLVDEVVPRILEGALPEIRAKLVPAVIDDLAESEQVRDLMVEQGRGVVGDAAAHLRTTTASADDRVESAFRRLVRADPGADDRGNGDPGGAGGIDHSGQGAPSPAEGG